MRRSHMVIGLGVAIATACEPEPPDPNEIFIGDESLATIIVRLDQRTAHTAEASKDSDADDAAIAPDDIDARLTRLATRMSDLELALSRLEQHGVERAAVVSFDPRATRLSGTNVQEALTEIENRVDELESRVLDDLGEPGPGLFDLRGKGKGKGKGGGPGGPPGGRGGPGGPEEHGGPGGHGGGQGGHGGGQGGHGGQGGGQGGHGGQGGGQGGRH